MITGRSEFTPVGILNAKMAPEKWHCPKTRKWLAYGDDVVYRQTVVILRHPGPRFSEMHSFILESANELRYNSMKLTISNWTPIPLLWFDDLNLLI